MRNAGTYKHIVNFMNGIIFMNQNDPYDHYCNSNTIVIDDILSKKKFEE